MRAATVIKVTAFLGALLLAQPGGMVFAKSLPVTDVWVVFKTHFDIGYNGTIAEVLAKYRGPMIENALHVIDANQALPPDQRFTWTVPGWPLQYMLGPEQTPERRARIVKAIKERALAVHALPFSMHTESLDLEDLVRGLHYSAQIARDNGIPLPRSAKMTDVPEHSRVLPTLLKHAGIDFLHLGCNPASAYPRFPRLFWWEGPDGSRLLTAYTHDYGNGIIPPKDWPAKNYLAMIMTGDNHGPPTAGEVEAIRKQAASNLHGVHIHFGTLDDFLKAIEVEKPELPIVRGDTPDTWIHGVMSMPIETKLARNIRPLEPALDSLNTHLKCYGLATGPLAPALSKAYEQSLLFGEHTWGLYGRYAGGFRYGEAWKKAIDEGKYNKYLAAFDQKREYIRTTGRIVRREIKQRLDLLARNVDADGKRIVVWNALPWPRSGMVEVEGNLLFAENIPGNGYKTFPADRQAFQPDCQPGNADVLDTQFYRVTFDLHRGGIASLIEKQTGRELVDKTGRYAMGQFMHERFSANEVGVWMRTYSRIQSGWGADDFGKPGMPGADKLPYTTFTPGNWIIQTCGDTATLTAGDTKGLGRSIVLKFTFDRYVPSVDCEWRITDKTPNPIPEGGWLCFPFAIKQPRFTLGRIGGPIDPASDIVPGAGRYRYAVTTGVTITGSDKAGVSLSPLDSPLVSLDQPGLWKHSLDYVPKVPTVFVNVYNNQWNTNFPLWQEGSWSERVRFWPGTDLVVPSWEARVPLLAAAADGPAGKLPQSQAGLSVSRRGVLVTAFGDNLDGQGTLLRVWDQSGATGQLVVSLPGRFNTATPIDLRGEIIGKTIRLANGSLTFDLHAYAPASFTLAK